MELSSSFSVSIFLLVLFAINTTIESVDDRVTTSSSNDLLTDICNSVKKELRLDDVPFCLQVFESVPGANESRDLKSLVKITVDVAVKNGTDIVDYIEFLMGQTSDKRLNSSYSECHECYDSFVYYYQSARQTIQNGGYTSLVGYSDAGFTNVDECTDSLKGVQGQDRSQLPQRNKSMFMLVYILADIFIKLQGGANHLI